MKLSINKTNWESFENIISAVVDWGENNGYANWEAGQIDKKMFTLKNALECWNDINKDDWMINSREFTELFINVNHYAEIVNDLSIDAAFENK